MYIYTHARTHTCIAHSLGPIHRHKIININAQIMRNSLTSLVLPSPVLLTPLHNSPPAITIPAS